MSSEQDQQDQQDQQEQSATSGVAIEAGPYRNSSQSNQDNDSDDDDALDRASTKSNYDSDEDTNDRPDDNDWSELARQGGGGGGGDAGESDAGKHRDEEKNEQQEELVQMAEELGGIDLTDEDAAAAATEDKKKAEAFIAGQYDEVFEEDEAEEQKRQDDEDEEEDAAAAAAAKEEELEDAAAKEDDLVEELEEALDLSVEEEIEEEFDNTPTLKTVAKWIQSGQCRKILVLSGAGVSCSAGIPDFRTPGTGLYDNLQRYNLPYPQAVFDLDFYRSNSDPFVSLAAEIWPGTRHSPTLTHSFVALLDKRGVLLRNYTQNIDGLEVLAGVSEHRLVECHGHFRTASCVNCASPYDGDRCRDEILNNRKAPRCRLCHSVVKPDIVFFGEGLPDRFGRLLRRDLDEADLLIVMGTSLTVAPVSLIPEMVNERCPRVLINRELVGDFETGPGISRDVFAGGDCDDSVRDLCRLMGWERELRDLHEAARIVRTDDEER